MHSAGLGSGPNPGGIYSVVLTRMWQEHYNCDGSTAGRPCPDDSGQTITTAAAVPDTHRRVPQRVPNVLRPSGCRPTKRTHSGLVLANGSEPETRAGDRMRRIEADLTAVAAALRDYQLRTLHDFASARGVEPGDWPRDSVCVLVATTLAADSIFRDCLDEGLSERQAWRRVAALCDMDVETLLRRRRLARQRAMPG